jgi:hypothetical protein
VTARVRGMPRPRPRPRARLLSEPFEEDESEAGASLAEREPSEDVGAEEESVVEDEEASDVVVVALEDALDVMALTPTRSVAVLDAVDSLDDAGHDAGAYQIDRASSSGLHGIWKVAADGVSQRSLMQQPSCSR